MLYSAEEILAKSPLAIVICNKQEQIIDFNQRFCAEFGLSAEHLKGQLYPSLPFEAIDKSATRVQLFSEDESETIRFQYWTEILDDGNTIHYFAKERDNRRIPTKIGASKIPKRASWVDFLDYEVSRSRRYDNPLSILKLHLVVHAKPANVSPDTLHETVNDTLMNELRWADMIGHTDQGSYLMVLPETPASALKVLREKIAKALQAQIHFISKDIQFDLVFGESCWQKNDDSKRLLKRARDNLVEALQALLAANTKADQ